MTKLGKVIKGIEIHLKPNSRCIGCPYPNNGLCGDQLYRDALELLKDQEAKVQCLKTKCIICPHCDNCDVDGNGLLKEREPVKPIDETCWNHTYGRCGHCRAPLPALEGLHSKFCWMCGKAVKWE